MSNISQSSPEGQAYADAIMDAVETIARQPGNGNMGAVLGALVGVQAHLIAGVSDAKIRKSLRRDLDKMLSSLIHEQVSGGTQARVQTIVRRAH